nr:hypothetical protein [Agrobacterium rosae]MDX8316287.1 hypothetical protein [Agrobacterium rosae]
MNELVRLKVFERRVRNKHIEVEAEAEARSLLDEVTFDDSCALKKPARPPRTSGIKLYASDIDVPAKE